MTEKKHIWIVDDEPAITGVYREILEPLGYKVSISISGEQALEMARDLSQPDLLLVDCLLPGISGKTFLESLKKDFPEIYNGAIRVGLSSLWKENDGFHPLELLNRVKNKPDSLEGMIDLVEELLAPRQQTNSQSLGIHP